MIVYHGSFTTLLEGGSYTIDLDTPVPVGKSFPIASYTTWTDGPICWYRPYAMLTGEVDGYYTQLVIRCGRQIEVSWHVVTGDEFTVQSGLATMADGGSMTATAAISDVNLDEAFIVASAYTTGGQAHSALFGTYFSANNQVTLSRENNYGALYVAWYAVTMEGSRVLSGSAVVLRTDTAVISSIPQIDTSKAFLLFNFGGTDRYRAVETWPVGRFLSDTEIEFSRPNTAPPSSSGNLTVRWFVVEHPKLRVQSGWTTVSSTDPVELGLEPIKVDRSFGLASAMLPGTEAEGSASLFTIKLDALKAILQRRYSVYTATVSSFVVEWMAPAAPQDLRPNTSIMPDEQAVFSWALPAGVIQTDYELEYREVGGEWQTTGRIVSSEPKHVFPPGTFDLGKHYEWRVGYWAQGEIDPSDSSAVIPFNTRDPVIHTPTPAPDSSVKVSIRDLGATLKSPYGNDIQLTIEVDDNPEFTSATTYTLPAVSSGESATVEHAFKVAGHWHVRMTATDTAANQTILTYTVFAGQFIQFLGTPNVQLQAPQATHVTVRVRGTTTEYTAVREPVSPPEKMVERLVYIDSGTQATCQAVAQELIAKWGREQVSVKGVIPLTLVLKPDQKVRVVIPEIGLNGELILQKKFHDVIPRSETHVELGDIMLSEQELIARIIDDLEGQSMYASALQNSYSTLESDVILLGQEVTESEINDIEQGQQLSDTDIQVIEMGGDSDIE